MNFFVEKLCLYNVSVCLLLVFQSSQLFASSGKYNDIKTTKQIINKDKLKDKQTIYNNKLYNELVKYWMLNFKDYVYFNKYSSFNHTKLSRKYNDEYVNDILLNLYTLGNPSIDIVSRNKMFNCAYAIVTFTSDTNNSQSKNIKQFVIYHNHNNAKIIEMNDKREQTAQYTNISKNSGLNCRLSEFENVLNYFSDEKKQTDVLTKHGEFQILKVLYKYKDYIIKKLDLLQNNNIKMNIKLFTYMDMCPNCWTVWYRCFDDLQKQYNSTIKQYNSKIKRKKQLNLDVNVYSIKPYSFTNHKYISALNSDNYDIKQYSNDFLKNLSNINEWRSRDFYKRRNSKKIDCNYNFSQRVDISNFNIIKKYHDLIDNVENNNNKIYNYDNNTIVYYYSSIRSILLDNTKQKKNNTKSKKQEEKEQQIVQPHEDSFLYKHLKSLYEFIIENKCDDNVFYIIQDCFKQVVIELFNLHIRDHDKILVKHKVNKIIKNTIHCIRQMYISPQKKEKMKKMQDHINIKEEMNEYYGINSDYDEYYDEDYDDDYDEEISDNDEYIQDNSEDLNLYDDILKYDNTLKDMLHQQNKTDL